MSKLFFDRMSVELFNLQASLLPHERFELDREVESITGKECDEVARTYSKKDFKKVAEEAIKRIKKRKQKPTEEHLQVYA